MVDLALLPRSFEGVRTVLPDGLSVSERVIDPLFLIDQNECRTFARLGGIRTLRGGRLTLLAPSNMHSWVLDDKIIRPLPSDASANFARMLAGRDPANLPYGTAVGLLEERYPLLPVEAASGFFKSGSATAAALEAETTIAGLEATLFPYQAKGVRWMQGTISRTGGLILADEMGLGKTLQIIALLVSDPPETESPALVICPTSLIANWVREFGRFAPGLSVLVHRGVSRAGTYRQLQRASVVISTYDTVVNDISIFSAFQWAWVICDEAQAIKNPASNRRVAVNSIPRHRAIPMTGTPVENTLLDLWSLADFAIPGLLGTQAGFQKKFPDSLDSARELSKITDPVILKRSIADVAGDLPERLDIDIPLELTPALASHYHQVHVETLASYPVAGDLVATLQLQLECAHPWLRRIHTDAGDNGETDIIRDPALPLLTPKMERTVDLLREVFFNRRKAIVFALFNRCGDLLREACLDLPEAYWNVINGSTPQEKRQAIIDEFTAHPGPGCLVLNPKAAGTGLNITAATVVIHFTPVWNPALEAQASARAHRRGQKQPVAIYRLFYEDTVERVMIDRSRWKNELGNELIPVSSRDAQDLQNTLELKPKLP